MAITDAYATAAEYRGVVGKTDTAQDAAILTDLTAISRYLEKKLGRFFGKDAAAVARVYVVPAAGSRLWVDDLAEAPTTVKLDDTGDNTFATTLETTDFELWPLNADKGPEPRPHTRIDLAPWGSRFCFYPGERVQVTAKFGWPSVPAAIKSATIQLTAILRLESPRATRRISELEETIEASPDAQSIVKYLLDGFKREHYV